MDAILRADVNFILSSITELVSSERLVPPPIRYAYSTRGCWIQLTLYSHLFMNQHRGRGGSRCLYTLYNIGLCPSVPASSSLPYTSGKRAFYVFTFQVSTSSASRIMDLINKLIWPVYPGGEARGHVTEAEGDIFCCRLPAAQRSRGGCRSAKPTPYHGGFVAELLSLPLPLLRWLHLSIVSNFYIGL